MIPWKEKREREKKYNTTNVVMIEKGKGAPIL